MFSTGKLALSFVAASAAVFVVAGTGSAAAERGADGHYYGAMAISDANDDGWTIGIALNAPDQATADAGALEQCSSHGEQGCATIVRFVDGCGAIARRDDIHTGGTGASLQDAERNAIAALGPGRPPTLSSDGSGPAVISVSRCNG
ncbi:DUF4189 domain-containing protein [Nocardia sp. MDA0666]|uniref:DUF4189 domain-containing protein n=1 Tax=Nocardia sp. MDA0666 TaxID=2135448 RepID=UPI001304F141|nr:DUF4189 domain-containing protein [Nocardia sp. MDA0666]